jgi:type I restriction enzyme S subunit
VDEGLTYVVGQASNQEDGIDWQRTRFHEHEGDSKKLKGYLRSNDILVNSTGTGTLGRVGYFTGSPDTRPCVADSHITVVRSRLDELDSRFGYYYLSSRPFQHFMMSALVTGATNQIELSPDKMGSSPVPLPPLAEQRRITDFLDHELPRLMRISHTCRLLRKLLQERRRAAVHAAITGGDCAEPMRTCSLGWATTLTNAWPVVPLKYVAGLGSGHTPSRTHPEYWENCSIPWISLFDVGWMRDQRQEYIAETEQKISELGMENSSACLHRSGTVALSRTASVGFSAIMATDMAVSQHFVTWTCGPRLKPEYLLFILRSMRQYFESVQVGTTNVTVFMPDLYSIKIPLPSLAEQEQIIARARELISAVDELDDVVCRESSLLEERRRALITAAVTGQIDVVTARGGAS